MKDKTHKHVFKRVKKEIIPGYVTEVEVCEECGLTLVNPMDAELILSIKDKNEDILKTKDIIILLLGLYPEIPLKETLMMKEAFLLEKEVSNEIKLNMESLNFYPYKFGPFSDLLENNLKKIDGDLIQIQVSESGKKLIKLTDEGKIKAKELIQNMPKSKVDKLKLKRRGWDQFGNTGILRRVYRNYPVYASKSKIKDDIM